MRTALSRGIHVITANKGPVAFAHRQLADEAAKTGASCLFEGAVMDGSPIFNLVRETMPGVTIRSFRGVVNTTNYLLAAMERGQSFDAALAHAGRRRLRRRIPRWMLMAGTPRPRRCARERLAWRRADATADPREGITPDTGARAQMPSLAVGG